ncbi:MAG: hypothetical protein HY731_04985 [Candidatus Tectomicrobia bacterium]|nr:hypothetical protein [Candidatus Tectomicrobia bacterium]
MKIHIRWWFFLTMGLLFKLASPAMIEAAPVIAFAQSSDSRLESFSTEIIVELSEASGAMVSYSVTGGTADGEGVDYTLEAGTLTFLPGEISKTIHLNVVNDEIDEEDETIIITLSNPVNASLGVDPSHTYTIIDNDTSAVSFKTASSDIDEAGSFKTMVVQLSVPADRTVKVDYGLTGTSEGGGVDYKLDEGTLPFLAGETSKTIKVDIVDDEIDEEDETVIITLADPEVAVLGDDIEHTLTIKDNDTAVVTIAPASSSNDESETTAAFEVKMSLKSSRTVTVKYAIVGTATGGGEDYTLPGDSISFSPGETRKMMVANINDDGLYEADETIIVTLTGVVNARMGRGTSWTYWILDNDEPSETLSLFRQEINSRDEDEQRKLFVIGPKSQTVNPRGIAVDKAGNLYISDQGPSKGKKEGSILMWPTGKDNVIRIIMGLTQPGDVELSPDQKKLIIAGPKGEVFRYALGISIRITNIEAFTGSTRIHLFSDTSGEKVAKVSPDGYFHFTGLLVPEQKKEVFIDIEHKGKTKRRTVTLGQPGEPGDPYGHTVLDLEF